MRKPKRKKKNTPLESYIVIQFGDGAATHAFRILPLATIKLDSIIICALVHLFPFI